jgi:hypothetical protein
MASLIAGSEQRKKTRRCGRASLKYFGSCCGPCPVAICSQGLGDEMDKAEFIEKAPGYYALAIAVALKTSGSAVTRGTIESLYMLDGGNFPDTCLVGNDDLWKRAVALLIDRNMIGIFHDTFGPPIYHQTADTEAAWGALREDPKLPFKNYQILGDHHDWLLGALTNVQHAYDSLEISSSDFDTSDREWEPIPLETTNKSLQIAIASLDKTITEVEQSNGYASEHSEERNFVLDNLRMLSRKLKSAGTVSVSYVKTHGLSVLKRLQDRFIDTSIGEGATEARRAIVHWLHEAINYFIS